MKKLTKIVAALAIAALTLSLTSCENSSKNYIYTISNQGSSFSGSLTEQLAVLAYFSGKVDFNQMQTLNGKESECDAAATTWFNNLITNANISETEVKAITPNLSGNYVITVHKKELGSSADYVDFITKSWALGGNQ